MIGAGIAAMHCIGLAALRPPAQLHWDAGYVLVPVAIVMTAATVAMRVSSRGPALPGRLLADCYSSWRLSDFISRPWRLSLLCPIR